MAGIGIKKYNLKVAQGSKTMDEKMIADTPPEAPRLK